MYFVRITNVGVSTTYTPTCDLDMPDGKFVKNLATFLEEEDTESDVGVSDVDS